ncbi:MAG: hypothetical protein SOY97_10440 [Candidatus Metalachnospira sp.]|nr:hypothetical protein [Candidatus Metalachnospira sp.]
MNLECRQNCMHQQNGKCRVKALGRRQTVGCSPCPFYEKKISI